RRYSPLRKGPLRWAPGLRLCISRSRAFGRRGRLRSAGPAASVMPLAVSPSDNTKLGGFGSADTTSRGALPRGGGRAVHGQARQEALSTSSTSRCLAREFLIIG